MNPVARKLHGWIVLGAVIALSACSGNSPSENVPYEVDTVVVRASARFVLNTGDAPAPTASDSTAKQRASSGTTTVTVTNSPSTNMTLDTSSFLNPTITSVDNIDFGSLQLSDLGDNNLKVCGGGGNTKCTVAGIRIFTTGVAGAGIWNAAEGYGAPLKAGQSSLATVGLSSANAVTLQSFTIPNNRNTVKLTDFVNPIYNVKADFSNAGAGSYSTTIVVEYFLALSP